MAALTRTSQLRVLDLFSKSAVAKYLMPLTGGLPSGLISRAAISGGCHAAAVQHPSRLLRRQAGGQLAQHHQKFYVDLLSFQISLPHRFSQQFQRHLPMLSVIIQSIIFGRTFSTRAPPPPAARQRGRVGAGLLCLFDTRHNSFGVLSVLHRRIVSAAPFVQPQGSSPVNEPDAPCTMPK